MLEDLGVDHTGGVGSCHFVVVGEIVLRECENFWTTSVLREPANVTHYEILAEQ